MFSYLVYSRDTVVYIRVWKAFPRLLYLDERCSYTQGSCVLFIVFVVLKPNDFLVVMDTL